MLLPFPSGTRRYIALLDVRDFEGISIGRSVPVALLVAGQVEEGGTLIACLSFCAASMG